MAAQHVRVALMYVGGRGEMVDTYVSGEHVGQVATVQAAISGRLEPKRRGEVCSPPAEITVHGIDFGLWTATLRRHGEVFATACGTAPRPLTDFDRMLRCTCDRDFDSCPTHAEGA